MCNCLENLSVFSLKVETTWRMYDCGVTKSSIWNQNDLIGFQNVVNFSCICYFFESLRDNNIAALSHAESWGLSAGYQPRPQVVDRGTTARYGGQLRYI